MSRFDLFSCEILLPDGGEDQILFHEAAFSLRQMIQARFGYAPSVVTEAPEGPAICFTRGADPLQCQIRREGDSVLLTAASASGLDAVSERFLSLFDRDGVLSEPLDHPICFDAADRSLAEEYGDLRVIYHNIFGYDRKPTINPERRFAFQAYLYRAYRAPLLCLQEFDKRPRELLAPMLEAAGYCEVEVNYSALGKNCSPIFYDPKRLSLIDCGFCPFTYVSAVNPAVCNNANTKNFTWGVFEDKRLQKRLIVILLCRRCRKRPHGVCRIQSGKDPQRRGAAVGDPKGDPAKAPGASNRAWGRPQCLL